ncbi:hypothetical protein [Bacillus sp. J14TS2]|uniref:hypothetical protein n=1 Tax=Bacillus sp. J14TS2 TaxID=2807188 RepID=UPI001BB3D355|nr:hypothetical protein [Bacillus sp. J14TS2]
MPREWVSPKVNGLLRVENGFPVSRMDMSVPDDPFVQKWVPGPENEFLPRKMGFFEHEWVSYPKNGPH